MTHQTPRAALDRPAVVYQLYTADRDLLYVGMTIDLGVRLQNHQHYSPWWPRVSRIRVTPQPDEVTAAREEYRAILRGLPLENRADNKISDTFLSQLTGIDRVALAAMLPPPDFITSRGPKRKAFPEWRHRTLLSSGVEPVVAAMRGLVSNRLSVVGRPRA